MSDEEVVVSTMESSPQAAGAHVASVASDQAREVTHEARAQARGVVEDARTRLHSEAQGQTEKLSSNLRRLGEQIAAMAEGRRDEAGPAAEYAQRAAQQAHRFADRLDQGGLDGVMNDMKAVARRRPGAFLVGAGVAGFALARILRNSSGSGTSSGGSSESSGGQGRPMMNPYSTGMASSYGPAGVAGMAPASTAGYGSMVPATEVGGTPGAHTGDDISPYDVTEGILGAGSAADVDREVSASYADMGAVPGPGEGMR